MSSQQNPPGPPYPPTTAGLGGHATISTDVPISSVLLLFYIGSAIGNMFIFQANRRKTHIFITSGALFGFSMARILTLCLRIGTATHPSNVSLAIAANIFVNAGILIVYVVNVVLALRILRARQPWLGWSRAVRVFARVLYVLIFVALVILIIFHFHAGPVRHPRPDLRPQTRAKRAELRNWKHVGQDPHHPHINLLLRPQLRLQDRRQLGIPSTNHRSSVVSEEAGFLHLPLRHRDYHRLLLHYHEDRQTVLRSEW